MGQTNNYRHPGDVLKAEAPYNRSAGQAALIGGLLGVAQVDVTSGDECAFAVRGVHSLAKETGALSVGDPLYWKASSKKLSGSAADGPLVAFAAADAESADAECDALLTPNSGQAIPQAHIAALTDAGGGTANGSIEDEGVVTTAGGNTYSDAAINTPLGKVKNNIKELTAKVNALIAQLEAAGISAAS
jgi:predicted RecA/RadA family phage recombinase